MLWHILHQLKSKNPAVRRKALSQLCQNPKERAARVLGAMLSDSDAEVRRLAVVALSKLEDERRFEPLEVALKDRDGGVVQAAAAAVKRGAPDRFVPLLEPLLHHSDAGVRGQAAQTLDSFGWRPDSHEAEIWYRIAKGQFFQASGFGMEALPALELALASCSSSMGAAVVEAIGHIGDPRVLRPLLQALRSNEQPICITAIGALTRLGAPEVVAPILGLLRNRNAQIRAVATEALGRLRAIEAVDAVCAILKDSAWEVRREAAETLGRLGDLRATEALIPVLSDQDADVRETAVIALGSLGDSRAIGPLVLALRDPSSSVRRIAAATLSRIDTDWSSLPDARAAAEELRPSLHDNDPGVRHFIGHLLAAMNAAAPHSAPLASTPQELLPEQRRKLAITCFLRILNDADRDLRQAAVEALGRLGGEATPAALIRARTDSDPEVRAAADLALQALDR